MHFDGISATMRWSVNRVIVCALVCALYASMLVQRGMLHPDNGSSLIFFRLFASAEPFAALILVGWVLAEWKVLQSNSVSAGPVWPPTGSHLWHWLSGLILLIALVAPYLIARIVGTDFPFSMDEYGSWLQAELIRRGQLVGRMPDQWIALREAITPVFVQRGGDAGEWVMSYLPGYSALLALTGLDGRVALLNPLMNLLAIAALWGVARSRWPDDKEQQAVATCLLVSSSQFIMTATTMYSMPAHLACNLIWLFGYTGTGRRSLIMGPAGFVACLLHQPVPHPLFAAPFLFRMVREKQWPRLAYLAVWYGVALIVFVVWKGLGGGAPINALGLPTVANIVVLVMNVTAIATWQTPIAAVLLLMTIRVWRQLDPFSRDLGAGIALTLVFYLFFSLISQGHGWGWRYGHQVLGSICLLAATSWSALCSSVGVLRARRLMISSLAVTCLLQLPLRSAVAWKFVRPFGRAHSWLAGQSADVVIVPSDSVWYGRDLVRNTPFLERPVLVHSYHLQRIGPGAIPDAATLVIRRVSVKELETLGMERLGQPTIP